MRLSEVVHVPVIYKEFESFSFPLYFPVRSTLSYKENMRFGDSRNEGGERDPV